jgi:hypothetical protein
MAAAIAATNWRASVTAKAGAMMPTIADIDGATLLLVKIAKVR